MDEDLKISKLIEWLEKEIKNYEEGEMMSLAESIHGETVLKMVLSKVKEIKN